MAILAWLGIIVSVIGLAFVGVGAFLSFNNKTNSDPSRTAFMLTLGGTIAFFLGGLLFLAFMFFSKGLDLNAEALRQLQSIGPNPDAVRNLVVDSTDSKFAELVGIGS